MDGKPTTPINDNPYKLTHLQKSEYLIIFLLVAVIAIVITLAIAWVVWKRWCGEELKRAREDRENGFEAATEFEHASTPIHYSRPMMSNLRRLSSSNSRSESISSLPRYSDLNPNFWQSIHQRSVEPSAPALESFRGPSTVPASSLETVSSEMGRQSEATNSTASRLPSYETIMRDHQ
uniref:uncharacterized protein LOC120346472 isoform X1 n=1 Tax=Styela clava TaxID=7725 RepID=UPI00193A4AB8|nr:uncharacterized protein LOC120346472 isoform X1 [Styela clava]